MFFTVYKHKHCDNRRCRLPPGATTQARASLHELHSLTSRPPPKDIVAAPTLTLHPIIARRGPLQLTRIFSSSGFWLGA